MDTPTQYILKGKEKQLEHVFNEDKIVRDVGNYLETKLQSDSKDDQQDALTLIEKAQKNPQTQKYINKSFENLGQLENAGYFQKNPKLKENLEHSKIDHLLDKDQTDAFSLLPTAAETSSPNGNAALKNKNLRSLLKNLADKHTAKDRAIAKAAQDLQTAFAAFLPEEDLQLLNPERKEKNKTPWEKENKAQNDKKEEQHQDVLQLFQQAEKSFASLSKKDQKKALKIALHNSAQPKFREKFLKHLQDPASRALNHAQQSAQQLKDARNLDKVMEDTIGKTALEITKFAAKHVGKALVAKVAGVAGVAAGAILGPVGIALAVIGVAAKVVTDQIKQQIEAPQQNQQDPNKQQTNQQEDPISQAIDLVSPQPSKLRTYLGYNRPKAPQPKTLPSKTPQLPAKTL